MMTRMIRPALIAALALAGTAAASAQAAGAEPKTIEPGYWDVTNKVQALAVLGQTKKEKRCITPAEVSKFVEGPSNRHYKCTYPTRVFQNGRITLKGSCSTKHGHTAKVQAAGSYSPSTFHLVADIDTTYKGVPLSGRATTDARRISDTCPTPAASASGS
jgi:hypothetical protein